MGKWLSVIIGAILALLGLWGIIAQWQEAVWPFIKAGVVLALFFIGVGAIIFGLGELRTPAEIPPAATPPSAPSTPPAAPPPNA